MPQTLHCSHTSFAAAFASCFFGSYAHLFLVSAYCRSFPLHLHFLSISLEWVQGFAVSIRRHFRQTPLSHRLVCACFSVHISPPRSFSLLHSPRLPPLYLLCSCPSSVSLRKAFLVFVVASCIFCLLVCRLFPRTRFFLPPRCHRFLCSLSQKDASLCSTRHPFQWTLNSSLSS